MLLSCGERTQEDACVCVIIYTVNSNLKQRVKPLETKDEFWVDANLYSCKNLPQMMLRVWVTVGDKRIKEFISQIC